MLEPITMRDTHEIIYLNPLKIESIEMIVSDYKNKGGHPRQTITVVVRMDSGQNIERVFEHAKESAFVVARQFAKAEEWRDVILELVRKATQ